MKYSHETRLIEMIKTSYIEQLREELIYTRCYYHHISDTRRIAAAIMYDLWAPSL